MGEDGKVHSAKPGTHSTYERKHREGAMSTVWLCEGKSGPWRNKEGKNPVKDTQLSVKDLPSEVASAKFSNITSWYRSL